ncbi:MAG: 30S ribosomal protein S17 [Solirubrobacteraceae bacterium]
MSEQNENTELEAADADASSEAPHASASDDAPASEAGSAAASAGESRAGASEPVEVLAPKERRARARAAKAAQQPARSQRSPEERQAERDEQRRAKAVARRTERTRARAKTKAAQATGQVTPPRERAPGVQKVRQGVVVSDKADKTITVRIDTARRHRRYDKIVRSANTLHAHDESNDAHTGDTVIVREARPLSRTKRWRLVQVVERAK